MSKLLHTLTKPVQVNNEQREYTASIYEDKIIVTVPYATECADRGHERKTRSLEFTSRVIYEQVLNHLNDEPVAWDLLLSAHSQRDLI